MSTRKTAVRALALLALGLASPSASRAQALGLDLAAGGPSAPKKNEAKKDGAKKAPPALDFGLDLSSDGARPSPPAALPPPPAPPSAAAIDRSSPSAPPAAAAPSDANAMPPPAPLAEAAPEPEPAPPPAPIESYEETSAPDEVQARVVPVALVMVGPAAVFRSLSAESSPGLVPSAQGAMSGMGLGLRFFPLRLSRRLARGALSDLSIESHYRRTFASARVQTAGAEADCGVDDDEVLARLSYRYPLPGERLPRVGLSAGWASERVLMRCPVPALSTRVRTVELHLTALEPILGETLQVEASGGPRFVISPHSSQAPARSFSLELWLAYHPTWWLYSRGGVRYTSTREQTDQGIGLAEQRTFVGVEVGASY